MAFDQQLVDRVLNSPRLPSLPAIALEIIRLVQEDEADVDKIAETISLDPALSSKLLKTVNSSFYGLPKTVASVHQAVIVLGLNSVKTLALGFSLVNNLTDAGGDGFDHMGFWRRSLYCATAAKLLCERLHIVQAEEVFIASLLQDVGVLALAQSLGPEYAAAMKQANGDHRKLSQAEQEHLGGDHAEIGGALAESWGLPPLLVESIRLHERPDEGPENLAGLIRTVTAGALAAELIDHPDDEERVGAFARVMADWFELERQEVEPLLKAVFKQARETQRLFELPTGELGQPEDILARANQVLERLSLATAHANTELQESNVQLQNQADLDEATALLNRRQFDARLDESFITAERDTPLSIVFIDIDNFGRVNDTHGHPVGDTVLRQLAGVVRGVVGSSGQAYRYGGDEFAVLCPGLSRADAAVLAEKVRQTIEQTRCEAHSTESGDPISLSLTASIGVATYEGALFKRPEQLIRAADKGAIAAKKNGLNAVRVFVPKGESKAA